MKGNKVGAEGHSTYSHRVLRVSFGWEGNVPGKDPWDGKKNLIQKDISLELSNCVWKKKKSEEEESGQEEIEKICRAGVAISIGPWEGIRIPFEILWESTETL